MDDETFKNFKRIFLKWKPTGMEPGRGGRPCKKEKENYDYMLKKKKNPMRKYIGSPV